MIMHSSWIDDKYINLLSFRLDRFKRVGQYAYNFRCPICGDSKKSKFKARGYVFPSKDKNVLMYKCHNCGVSMQVKNLIREIDDALFKEYSLEMLKESGGKEKIKKFIPDIEKFSKRRHDKFDPLKGLKKISQLSHESPVKKYINERMIPNEYHHKLYYCKRFMEWINTIVPDKFDENQLKRDEPRLVIPFIDRKGYVFGVTGRSFKKNSIRYLTIKFDDDKEKVYGLEDINLKKRVYVVEGPIDSFFIDNCLAFAGSDGQIDTVLNGCDYTVILDNEPRNEEIVKKMKKLINSGRDVCIWPESVNDYKDINDMIIAGMQKDQIKHIIDSNTFNGLKATLKFNEWKKI